MLSLERTKLRIEEKEKLLKLEISKLKLENVKLLQKCTNFNLSMPDE
jgi:hypothetical protein